MARLGVLNGFAAASVGALAGFGNYALFRNVGDRRRVLLASALTGGFVFIGAVAGITLA